MLTSRLSGWRLDCDRCGLIIRADIPYISDKHIARLRKKKSFCGSCIQKRIKSCILQEETAELLNNREL